MQHLFPVSKNNFKEGIIIIIKSCTREYTGGDKGRNIHNLVIKRFVKNL